MSPSRGYPPASLAWFVWSLGAALYLIAFYQRVAPAVLTQELQREFALTGAALGNLSAFYFYGYVAMQIPTGLIADQWGPRKLLTVGAALTAAGTLLFALAPTVGLANAGRLAIGAAAGVAFVAMLKLASHWMPARQFALASGVALFVGVMGATLAGAPLRLAADAMGWRNVMVASAALTAIVAVAIWLVARDDPVERGYQSYFPHDTGAGGGASVWQGLRTVLGYRNTILLYLIPGAFSGITLMFAGLWGVPFLVTHYGYSTAEAATLASVLLISWSAASIVWGTLSHRIGRRRTPMIAGLVVSQALWAALVFVPGWSRPALVVLLVLLGIATAAFILTFTYAKESVPARLAGTVSGIANMGVMTGGMVMQPLAGWVLDRYWTGALTAGGARLYDLAAYRTAFSLVFVWGFVSLACLLLTKETHCKQAA
ncbi:MAG: MFS transporter [Betaproteobacteria bacterium]|nr:MFS transporter [Betaproteobacteria bacterium]